MKLSLLRLAATAIALGLLATACSSAGGAEAAAIETNEGGVLVKPPDLLAADAEPTAEAVTELPGLVDGLSPTPVVDFAWFDGAPGSTAEFAGRPTVLNFWASWCPPCIAEMPEFEAVSQTLAGKVAFVGLNVGDERDAANQMVAQTGVTYPLADDPDSEIFRSFGGFVMPTTVFLNAQGQVAHVWAGALTGDELRILIDRHILAGSL